MENTLFMTLNNKFSVPVEEEFNINLIYFRPIYTRKANWTIFN